MSAFICNDSHFNAVYSALKVRKSSGGYQWSILDDVNPQLLVQEWRALNVAAVNYRYEDETAVPVTPLHLVSREAGMSDGRLYGLLTCLRYQCSEGDYPDTDTFKRLDEFCEWTAARIAREHPDYVWGID